MKKFELNLKVNFSANQSGGDYQKFLLTASDCLKSIFEALSNTLALKRQFECKTGNSFNFCVTIEG